MARTTGGSGRRGDYGIDEPRRPLLNATVGAVLLAAPLPYGGDHTRFV